MPGSDDVESFWEHLRSGTDLITDTPKERWDAGAYYDASGGADKTYTVKGGFIPDAGWFDATYFNISDSDALGMDPQQRLILELVRALWAHAGYTKAEVAGSNTGVYIGAKDNTYAKNNYHLLPADAYQHTIVNTISNMIAARISDFYHLTGPSQIIDTACSSSLVAIHEACEALQRGKVSLAIAGGISIMVDAFSHIGFSQAQVLSRDGKSYVFDERAQGFVLGEGGGLVLLKDYAQAQRDGDRILGVIAGSAVNNDGKTMGLTVPNKEGQQQVIEQVMSKTGINPAQITYYEAHGTGTLLGDPIEVKAATEVYQSLLGSDQRHYCAMGSVKSNVGHTMTAAGVTGLIKILLQMQHQTLVPTLHCERPHPRFGFEDSPFYPNTSTKPWEVGGTQKRTAALSSFGFGGTNCHMIVEAADPHEITRRSLPVERLSQNYYWLGQEIVQAGPRAQKVLSSTNVPMDGVSPMITPQDRSEAGIEKRVVYDQPLLRDHKILNQQVLMGVAYLSMGIETGYTAFNDAPFTIEKMVFSNPLVLNSGQHATILSNYSIESQVVRISYTKEGIEYACAQGAMARPEERLLFSEDLKSMKATSLKAVSGGQFYDQAHQNCYGPTLRTVEKVYRLSASSTLVALRIAPDHVSSEALFVVPPAIFDGAHVASTMHMIKDV
ncbi:MAG: beta-ketoacyl synthase N-terminal-like domain-containing protein, partial [Cyanobacteria bacterium P01_C01_bin.147]